MEDITTWTTEDLLTRRDELTFPFTAEDVLAELEYRIITDTENPNKGGTRPTHTPNP